MIPRDPPLTDPTQDDPTRAPADPPNRRDPLADRSDGGPVDSDPWSDRGSDDPLSD